MFSTELNYYHSRPGTQFTYEDLRTKAECESVGYCSPLGHDTYQVLVQMRLTV